MRVLTVKGVRIDDTFAEAFGMRATALIITADTARWARQAALNMTGFATSVIGCGCEAGIDCELTAKQTPDGRPGVRVLLFAVSTAELQKQLQARVGQSVLTSPGSACYAGIEGEEALRLGIISELVPQDELSERAIQIATNIGSNSPAAVRASLRNLWSSIDLPTDEAVDCALSATNVWRNHPDAIEGRNAHAEGRPAHWVDKE